MRFDQVLPPHQQKISLRMLIFLLHCPRPRSTPCAGLWHPSHGMSIAEQAVADPQHTVAIGGEQRLRGGNVGGT
jgi:hypothetical protein